jgi:hypothetical protein
MALLKSFPKFFLERHFVFLPILLKIKSLAIGMLQKEGYLSLPAEVKEFPFNAQLK